MKQIILCFTTLVNIFLLLSCNSNFNEESDEIYYKDYDFFNQKGISELSQEDLEYPYFEQNRTTDSTIILTFHNDFWTKEKIEVPKQDKVVYNFFDINDGPKHYFSKLVNDKLVRYGYDSHPQDVMNSTKELPYYELIPNSIEIITKDTFYLFSEDCFFDNDINTIISVDEIREKIIFPFEINEKNLSKNCHHFCYYYNENGRLWEYNRDTQKYLKSDGGLYGFDRQLKSKWKSFHNINRYL